MKNILDYLYIGVRDNPERCVFNFLDCSREPFGMHQISMRQLYDKARDIAVTLKRRGAKKGDRAVIFSMQDAGTIYAVLGCMMEGVVFTVIPPPIDDGKLARFISVLKSCQPKFLISNSALEQESKRGILKVLLRKAFLRVIALKRIYTDRVSRYDGVDVCRVLEKDELVYLQYTSGSTSEPKGVMVTNGQLMSCIDSCREVFDFTQGNNLVSWVPFYHNIGLLVTIFLSIVAERGTAYFIPTLQFLQKPTNWIKVISDFKVNITVAPNSAYEVCTKLISKEDAKKYDLSHVTLLVNGSEFVFAHTIETFCDLFNISQKSFAAGYGLSECVCIASLSPLSYKYQKIDTEKYFDGKFIITENEKHKRVVSLGASIKGLKVLAVREDGSPCGKDEIGEIYIQGDSVCQGYWKNSEQTKRFYATVKGFEGFFYRTGDMGIVFDGELYLTGRLSEMIIVNGKNIFPSDVTLLLQQRCPTLPKEAIGVFSTQTENREEAVLCIESEECDFTSLARNINHVVAQSYNFSFNDIVFVRKNTLPRTDNRKIKNNTIRQLYEKNKLDVLYSTKTSQNKGINCFGNKVTALSAGASIEEIRICIRNVFQSFIGNIDFDDNTLFTDLGTNSLTVIEMLNKLECQAGVEIDVRQIVSSLTVKDLAHHIQLSLRGEKHNQTDLAAECILANDIQPQRSYTLQPDQCRNIFLTGSSGFLGAHLIQSLIKQAKDENITVFCHVRAENQQSAMERIVKNMQFFRCWDEKFKDKIVAVPGDLKKPNLGIENELYTVLCNTVDAIYHNGAVLNFLFSYNYLKQTNVDGTVECLRFACTGNPKYFHYVSSYSVYDNPSHFNKVVLESNPLLSSEGYFLGYSETKWVAEKLVSEAATRGLRATVYRPGEITGSLKGSIWKLEDLVSRTIVSCIQMSAAPDIDVQLPLTPVDYVSDAIIYISRQTNAVGKCFNLINKNTTNVNTLGNYIKKAGYDIEILPYTEWTKKLVTYKYEENALSILSRLFTDKRQTGESLVERYGSRQAQIDTSNTDTLLKGSEVSCPILDENVFRKYIETFAELGYIPKAAQIKNQLSNANSEAGVKNETNTASNTRKTKKLQKQSK